MSFERGERRDYAVDSPTILAIRAGGAIAVSATISMALGVEYLWSFIHKHASTTGERAVIPQPNDPLEYIENEEGLIERTPVTEDELVDK